MEALQRNRLQLYGMSDDKNTKRRDGASYNKGEKMVSKASNRKISPDFLSDSAQPSFCQRESGT